MLCLFEMTPDYLVVLARGLRMKLLCSVEVGQNVIRGRIVETFVD